MYECRATFLKNGLLNNFVSVKSFFAAQRLLQKAMLLVNNASYHSDCQFLSPDKTFL